MVIRYNSAWAKQTAKQRAKLLKKLKEKKLPTKRPTKEYRAKEVKRKLHTHKYKTVIKTQPTNKYTSSGKRIYVAEQVKVPVKKLGELDARSLVKKMPTKKLSTFAKGRIPVKTLPPGIAAGLLAAPITTPIIRSGLLTGARLVKGVKRIDPFERPGDRITKTIKRIDPSEIPGDVVTRRLGVLRAERLGILAGARRIDPFERPGDRIIKLKKINKKI